MSITGTDLSLAANLLLQGKLVAIPTETVYGLAANALDEKAVLTVFEVKDRPFFDPLIIHTYSLDAAKEYADFGIEPLLKLANTFWPGPLTLLLPKLSVIPPIVTSGLNQVAIRVPDHPLTLQLLKMVKIPLAAPSANPFGYVSPTQPAHVEKQLGHKIDYILDGGNCSVGLESTIVGLEDGKICVYRLGGLAVEEIEKIVGKIELRINNSSNPKAPGQLKSHYAPKKPLIVGDLKQLSQLHKDKKMAAICFGDEKLKSPNVTVYNLSVAKNLQEAAINLFKYLRLIDDSDADIVICEELPATGLGLAINDRLRRAASKH